MNVNFMAKDPVNETFAAVYRHCHGPFQRPGWHRPAAVYSHRGPVAAVAHVMGDVAEAAHAGTMAVIAENLSGYAPPAGWSRGSWVPC